MASVFAELEQVMIAERTKAALKVKFSGGGREFEFRDRGAFGNSLLEGWTAESLRVFL